MFFFVCLSKFCCNPLLIKKLIIRVWNAYRSDRSASRLKSRTSQLLLFLIRMFLEKARKSRRKVFSFSYQKREFLTLKSISLYLFAMKPWASKTSSDSTNENHKLHALQPRYLASRLEEGCCKQWGFFIWRKVEMIVEGSPKQLLKDEMKSESHRHLDRRCS